MAEVGSNNVCFSVDYPFESIEEHVDWWRTVPVGEQVWKDMACASCAAAEQSGATDDVWADRNAIKAFKLPLDFDKE